MNDWGWCAISVRSAQIQERYAVACVEGRITDPGAPQNARNEWRIGELFWLQALQSFLAGMKS